jgi:hypothetical protein
MGNMTRFMTYEKTAVFILITLATYMTDVIILSTLKAITIEACTQMVLQVSSPF